ncbi:MAG TPA: bacteriocin fulvocin C-related protein [Thermoanaerobaculia bacterium]|nr:bacteriocin fulvocin C-related protein [Thermoanaerobaculia bacterium]
MLFPVLATATDRAVVPFADVAPPTYDELQELAVPDRAAAVRQLPAESQASLWNEHLLRELAAHPEFSGEQRAVIQEAFALLTPQMFAVERSDARWAEEVGQPLERFTERARQLFEPRVARELFTQMGPAVRDSARTPPRERSMWMPRKSASSSRRVATNEFPRCQCSIISDWCTDSSGLGMIYCAQTGGCYFTSTGCGTFFQYACNGMCRDRPT